jgi:fluoride exporter
VTTALAVALAAGVGSVLRYVVDRLVQSRHGVAFPFGTLTVNVTGSLLLGVVTGLGLEHGLAPDVVLVLSAGLAGGYTTLSTWAWETVSLAEAGARGQAAANAVGTLAACLAAAGLGLAVTTA